MKPDFFVAIVNVKTCPVERQIYRYRYFEQTFLPLIILHDTPFTAFYII